MCYGTIFILSNQMFTEHARAASRPVPRDVTRRARVTLRSRSAIFRGRNVYVCIATSVTS